jgi:hypothetical protein
VSYSSDIGYLASALVLAAFGMKDMVNLRIAAICSNVAFIAYALVLHLPPILVLHVILLPLNGWRLAQALQCSSHQLRPDRPTAPPRNRHRASFCPALSVTTKQASNPSTDHGGGKRRMAWPIIPPKVSRRIEFGHKHAQRANFGVAGSGCRAATSPRATSRRHRGSGLDSLLARPGAQTKKTQPFAVLGL